MAMTCPGFASMHGPGIRGVLTQRQMRSRPVVVIEVRTQIPTERVFAPDDHVIDTLPANRPYDAFHVGTLPGRPSCREHFLDAQRLDLPREFEAENVVAITPQVTGNLVKREGLPQLLAGPLGGGMGGDIEMQDATAVVSQHEEHVEGLEANRWHREKIDRDHGLD